MNFTREPIIETVITPREGYRLLLRGTKGGSNEEYNVEAIEIVSFGNSIFYRSTEKPKAFLLPVGDYEVIETKETKVSLKAANLDRSIKIGTQKESSGAQSGAQPTQQAGPQDEKKQEGNKKHNRRKSRRRKGGGNNPSEKNQTVELKQENESVEVETVVAPPVFSRLFPPPPTLIKEKLSKAREAEILEANLLSEKKEEEVELPPISTETTEKIEPKKEVLAEPEPLEEPIYNPDSLDSPEKVESEHSSET